MKQTQVIYALTILTFILTLTILPVFPDPYEHEDHVCFWTWLWRELDELEHGERE